MWKLSDSDLRINLQHAVDLSMLEVKIDLAVNSHQALKIKKMFFVQFKN
jgi:hypothetical protein